MASTEAQKRANRVYREKHKPMQFSIQYKTDKTEGVRLKNFLAESGQTANSYIKNLIKQDLDNKGIDYPEE